MKTHLFYYSATGNTKLACEYIQKRITGIELFDIAETPTIVTDKADIIGIATPVFYLNIPPIVNSFLDSLHSTHGKPAFILETYGMMQGKSLSILEKKLSKKGLLVFDNHSLRMPESFPPYIAKGWTDNNAPKESEMSALGHFLDSIRATMRQMESGKELLIEKVKSSIFNMIIPAPSHTKIMKQFGDIKINEKLCNSCGICENACGYKAVVMDTKPTFNRNKCHACFCCINNCPHKAISSTRYLNLHQYSGPSTKLLETFR